ncbi:MAG: DUF6458 family protein [Gemmatimonadales bacterium]
MGFVLSLLLIAVGAILRWAVTAAADGINLDVVGLILIVIGLVGFLLATIEWLGWWSWRESRRPVATQRVVRRREETVDVPPRTR